MRLQRLLCAVDFSSGSQHALHRATQLAAEADAELVIAHAWYVPPVTFGGEITVPVQAIEDVVRDATLRLEAAVQEATRLGAKRVSSRLVGGVPWHAIVEELETTRYDLAILGTHGRTGLSRILLGSFAERVVRHAPCSVLTIPPGAEPRPFSHVLVPIDSSPASHHAVDLAVELAQPGGVGITLLHVIEVPIAPGTRPGAAEFARELDRNARATLAAAATELRGRVRVEVSTRCEVGRPRTEILSILERDRTYDLVILGSHGRTGIKRVLMGSVAEAVVRHARIPVLVARSRG